MEPCKGCPMRAICKAQEKACAAFLYYVERGDLPIPLKRLSKFEAAKGVRTPREVFYQALFGNNKRASLKASTEVALQEGLIR